MVRASVVRRAKRLLIVARGGSLKERKDDHGESALELLFSSCEASRCRGMQRGLEALNPCRLVPRNFSLQSKHIASIRRKPAVNDAADGIKDRSQESSKTASFPVPQ